MIRYTYYATKIFDELRNIDLLEKELQATIRKNPNFAKFVKSTVRSKLAYAKQVFSCTIRKINAMHISMFLVPETTPKNQMKKEHLTPIDTAWAFAKTLNYDCPADLKKLAEYLRDYVFVRVFLSLEDNEIVNSAVLNYSGAVKKMPVGWKPGDCRWVRYLCLGEAKVNELKRQYALL